MALGILHTPQKCKINMQVYTFLKMHFLRVLEKGKKVSSITNDDFCWVPFLLSYQFEINRYLNLVMYDESKKFSPYITYYVLILTF